MRFPHFILALLLAASADVCAEDLKVEIKDIKKQSILVMKAKVKQEEIGKKLGEIFPKLFAGLGVKPLSAPLTFFTGMANGEIEIEAGAVVPEGTKGSDKVVASELPGGKTAFTVHTGPYETLPKTYEKLKAWLAANGHTIKNVSWEIYISDPGNTKPEELKTEIYMPIDEKK